MHDSNTDSNHGAHSSIEDARNKSIRIYINGELFAREDAKVSVYDSGFMLGDGVWEGLRLHNGKFLFEELHIERLFQGAKSIDMNIGKTHQEISDALAETIAANNMYDGVHVRLIALALIGLAPHATDASAPIIQEYSSRRQDPCSICMSDPPERGETR